MSNLERSVAGGAAVVASPRVLQELAETVQRSRLGGAFYVLAWAAAGYASAIPEQAPLPFALVAVAFVGLALARLRSRPVPPGSSVATAEAKLWQIWLIVLANSALWGAVSYWLVMASSDETARTVAAVSSFAFSTAFAHNFCMRRGRAMLAISLLYLPTIAAYVQSGVRVEFLVVATVYLAYVVLALRRSHREYLQRLDLEDELRRQRDLYERQSQLDSLTGLPNRRYFAAVLAQWIDEARVQPLPFALLMLDLDWFKAVNDRHGHTVGDACLRVFAQQLQNAFALPGDIVARLGGEEFAVLIRDSTASLAMKRAEEFRQSLAGRPLPLAGIALGLTVSIGVGAFEPRRHAGSEEFLQAIDKALYRAKASGRNRVQEAEAVE